MGKNLKGKQLEKGISQRKDGMYSARFVTKRGKRVERYFEKYPEARRWLADARYEDAHGDLSAASGMTVNAWFSYWMDTFKQSVRPNTQRNYRDRYRLNIQPVIGHMQLADVKQLHCQSILNAMKDSYAASTINQTFITLNSMFKSACQNDIIPRNPVKGITLPKQLKRVDDIRFLVL